MNSAPAIWLTRPLGDSQRMADMLAQVHVPTLIAPLMDIDIRSVTWPQEKPDAMLITSRFAAMATAGLPEDWRDVPVYCVGAATARILQHHGLTRLTVEENGVIALLPAVRDGQKAGDRVLYLCGEDIKIDVAPLMAYHDITVERVIAYHAIAVPSLPEPVKAALTQKQLQGVIFTSPRGVRIAQDLLEQNGLLGAMAALDIYCLSLDIAVTAAALGGKRLHVCPMPTYEAMMELLSAHAIRATV